MRNKSNLAGLRKKVLFVCTHNAARSQMAEALLRVLRGNDYEAYSAGTHPTQISPYVIRVMNEIDIDMSRHRAKGVDEFDAVEFDVVVTVCDHAKETCPLLPAAKRHVHMSFPDPSSFEGTKAERIAFSRSVRDKIRAWILERF